MKKGIACLILTIMVICASQWTAFGLAEEIQPLSSQELKNKWNINPSVKKTFWIQTYAFSETTCMPCILY